MRYIDIDTVSFNNKDGITVPVKDVRPIPSEPINMEIDVRENVLLDEICVRNDIYGENTEDQSYRIFDANVTELFEAEFDMSKIRRLKIPV